MPTNSRSAWSRLGFSFLAVILLSCVEARVEQPTYEFGETGTLIVHNPSRFPMAIGGCNPSYYQERLPGRWVSDPLIRPACVFHSEPGGRHTLTNYQLIRPKQSLDVAFSTAWVAATPAIIRVLQRVSTGCEAVATPGEPLTCHAVEVITTDPVIVFEQGTSDVVALP